MNCHDCQNRLGEEAESSAPDLAAHLATCPVCRAVHDTWATLDAELSRRASATTLPADFNEKLRARLPTAKPRLSPAEIALRRAQYEREYHAAMMASERWRFLLNPVVLRRMLTVVGASLFGGILLTATLPMLLTGLDLALRWWTQGPTQLLLGVFGLLGSLLALGRAGLPVARRMPRW